MGLCIEVSEKDKVFPNWKSLVFIDSIMWHICCHDDKWIATHWNWKRKGKRNLVCLPHKNVEYEFLVERVSRCHALIDAR
eukprot:5319775-Heterocapsa_arctica.AAC.1